MPVPAAHARRFVYHTTHLSNLEGVLRHGILSYNEQRRLGLDHHSIAAQSIQDRRARMTVTTGPGGANSGAECWGTNLDGGYAPNLDVTLTSATINLPSATTATLNFQEWSDIDGAPDEPAGNDVGSVEILDADNGDALLATVRAETGTGGSWKQASIDISAHAGMNIKVRFRFISDNDGFEAPGWFIDDVQVAYVP